MSDQDDMSGDDPAEDEAFAAYEQHRDALQDLIGDYCEDSLVDPALAGQLLLEIALGYRVSAYGAGVENPSVAGLKLDLDRLVRQVSEFVREIKKNAEQCIEDIKLARAEAEEEEAEESEEADGEDEEDKGKRN